MDNTLVEKDQLFHFSHNHPLSLLYLQPNHKIENVDDQDEDEHEHEDEDDFVEEKHHYGQCSMCDEQIWSFHLCYYSCKSCDYSLHKFCAELPQNLQNHPLHSGHNLTLSKFYQNISSKNYHNIDFEWKCSVCNYEWNYMFNYHCSICKFNMDIVCATMSEQKINHPSHPHQLEGTFGAIVSKCVACGNKHEGEFFQCAACPMFRVGLDCALMPSKLLIQNHTNGSFDHSHPLTLAYSFPYLDRKAQFFPFCRVCDENFHAHLWVYKCEKCRYYVHIDCATSKREPFMSILQTTNLGKTFRNFKDDEHPNLLHCPFHDEGDSLVKHRVSNQKEFIGKQNDGEMLNHSSHDQHPLILFYKQTSVDNKMVSLHDPMKRTQLLCDGCVRPIMMVPFYKCCRYVEEQCCFVLHEWCANLPPEVQDYVAHPAHTLLLLTKIPSKLFGVFTCAICELPSNGFAYGCTKCEFYVDINCAFIPKEITHDAHPDHLLSKVSFSGNLVKKYCNACEYTMKMKLGFYCPSCEFYIHVRCALFLPKVVKHKLDKHTLSLRYNPVENHIGEYFCEICEDEFDPWQWFYHCTTCDQSMHAACVPLILQYDQATYARYKTCLYRFLNVKFKGTLEIKGHSHRLAFVQGLETDGECSDCGSMLEYSMIFKCLECDFALHYDCASSFVS